MSNRSPVILIDGYSQIFRVFYAIAHLSRRDGFPTNALFGFARLLLQLEKEFAPRAGAMFFDCGKPAFRLELSCAYKSNRPPMPEALKLQMPLLRELAELFGWQICQCSNYEADDLIGAAVKSDMSRTFVVISSDKDLSQLIDDHAFMLIPCRSGGGFEKRSVAEVVSKFGVNPDQIIDYLALLGDSSDAIEGVPTVGAKTAAAVLNKCGSLEKFFAAPETIANVKLREKLLDAADLIRRNQKLVALRTDWPAVGIASAEEMLVKRAPDWQKIAEFAVEYELKSILKDLPVKVEVTEKVTEVLTGKVTDAPCAAAKSADSDDLFSWGAAAAAESEPVKSDGKSDGSASDKPTQGTLF